MKRVFRLIALSLMFVLLLAMTAQADLIAEWGHEYDHRDLGCQVHNRIHIMNCKDGAVKVYASPHRKIVVGSLPNGIELEVHCTLKNGKWGYVRYSTGKQPITGWIKLNQTILKYDGQSFLDEHKKELYPDDGTAIQMLEGVERPCAYAYPGAPAKFSSLGTEGLSKEDHVFECLYQDSEGRIWAYMGKTKYGRDWICLSDPKNTNLPVVEYQTINLYPSSGEVQSNLTPIWVLPTCLVAGVAVLSFVLILVLKRKQGTQSWNNTQPGVTKPKTMKGRMKSLQCTGWRGDDRDFEA